MITITTGDGKFFFSDFVNLFEEQSAEIDENALDLKELQYLLSAYNTKRIYINEEDYVKVRDRIALLSASSSGGGGDIDPALLGLKEDKLVEIPQSALDIPVSMGIPLYTLDTGGNYILCEPDSWVDIGDGMCIPAYSKSKLQSV